LGVRDHQAPGQPSSRLRTGKHFSFFSCLRPSALLILSLPDPWPATTYPVSSDATRYYALGSAPEATRVPQGEQPADEYVANYVPPTPASGAGPGSSSDENATIYRFLDPHATGCWLAGPGQRTLFWWPVARCGATVSQWRASDSGCRSPDRANSVGPLLAFWPSHLRWLCVARRNPIHSTKRWRNCPVWSGQSGPCQHNAAKRIL
jgi:hypothetical protein